MRVFLIGDGDLVEIMLEELIRNNVDVYLLSTGSYSHIHSNYEKLDDYSMITKKFLEDKDISSFDKCIISLEEKRILDIINISSIASEIGVDVLVLLPSRKYESIFNRLGVSYIVPSYDIAVKTVGEILLKSGPVESITPFIEDYFIARINVLPESKICNKKVSELNLRNEYNLNIIVAFRKEVVQLEKGVSKVFVDKVDVRADTVMDANMSIVVVGPLEGIKKFTEQLYHET